MTTLQTIGSVFREILPIFGVLALLALVVVLIKVVQLLSKLNKTMEVVNGYVADMNVTVKTINNVSFSIEAVRVSLERMVKGISENWTKSLEAIKAQINAILEKLEKKDSEKKEETIVVETKEEKKEAPVEDDEVKED